MTQLELARRGEVTPAMLAVAADEGIDAEALRDAVARGEVIVPANKNHTGLAPLGIGRGLRTKINANIGTSADCCDPDLELAKLRVCVEYKADTVMDLSTAGDLDAIRRLIIDASTLPVGTVPIYQAGIKAIERRGSIVAMPEDDLFDAIARHARDGVDFATVHCGVTREAIERLKREGRIVDIVSRGGSFLTAWMLHNERENPLYEHYDRLLDIAREHDMTLSLGDGLRPGCIADATDRAQVQELLVLGELVERAWAAGVQVMVEGPGHVPLDQVVANVQLQKRICKGAPFYVLGPLVTDVAAGYDHITGAIGGAIAAAAGADYLCYVTPSEHLALPGVEEVREGIVASRIAAHAADIVKGIKGARDWDLQMSRARKALDWEEQARLSLDPARSRAVRQGRGSESKACSMCGPFCAMELVSRYFGTPSVSKC